MPPVRAAAVARTLRAQGCQVAAVARSGKLAAQLARLETQGFGSWVHLPDAGGAPTQARRLGTPTPSPPEG
ncbi:MAG: hypothetical protein ACRDX8_10370 [Acidimicrobiales bacterium]